MTDSRDSYSPERRTALVLTGVGADGVYHAGVLRALDEAGVKIDLVAGRGMGAIGAVLAAVDGTERLWRPRGLWRVPAVARLYGWRWPVRTILALLTALAIVIASPLLLIALVVPLYPLGLVLGMIGLDSGAALVDGYSRLVGRAFAPDALPTWLPRVIAALTLATAAALAAGSALAWWQAPLRRRLVGNRAWALLGAPLDSSRAVAHFTTGIWDLLRGGGAITPPRARELSRRFCDLLTDNLGQPGFRELLLVVHDLDARRDLVFGLVREPFRRALFPPPTAPSTRRAEGFDLAGLAREHLLDPLRAALSVPGLTEPALVPFGADTYWRGEVHRLTDRPAALGRLLEEAAAAGAEQAIVVSAAAEPPTAHELVAPRIDALGRLSEQAASAEASALRDALHHQVHRFRGVYAIRPSHNPVRALDLAGVYDERSDRRQSLDELMERGYEDAYRQFIEPLVGGSGERMKGMTASDED
ncbi:MAG: patatin-like phospholipase family protein [Vicinamibacterales bacterium]